MLFLARWFVNLGGISPLQGGLRNSLDIPGDGALSIIGFGTGRDRQESV